VVKEAVFNMLGSLEGERAIDLFAGSGALGIEAISRAAAHVVFVERDERAAAVIRRNLDALGYRAQSQVVRAEVSRWLRANVAEAASAGVILVDPPYNDAVLETTLKLLDEMTSGGSLVVVEHSSRRPLPPLARLRPARERRYGDTAVTLLEAPPD
jgi:16S rRNA (guanine966-N2)-methyltransferase